MLDFALSSVSVLVFCKCLVQSTYFSSFIQPAPTEYVPSKTPKLEGGGRAKGGRGQGGGRGKGGRGEGGGGRASQGKKEDDDTEDEDDEEFDDNDEDDDAALEEEEDDDEDDDDDDQKMFASGDITFMTTIIVFLICHCIIRRLTVIVDLKQVQQEFAPPTRAKEIPLENQRSNPWMLKRKSSKNPKETKQRSKKTWLVQLYVMTVLMSYLKIIQFSVQALKKVLDEADEENTKFLAKLTEQEKQSAAAHSKNAREKYLMLIDKMPSKSFNSKIMRKNHFDKVVKEVRKVVCIFVQMIFPYYLAVE